jgi:hypothetical protein
MSILRRCATFVTCLLLQLTTLGTQAACDAHGRNDATQHVQHDRTRAPAPASSGDCGVPGATASCESMPVCAVTLALPTRVVASATVLSSLAALPEPASTHSHLVSGPEVPPPRG